MPSHQPNIATRVRQEYAAEADRYDRRWAAYLRGSMGLLRPWLADVPIGTVLDVGCGTGVLLASLRAWGTEPARYVGVDASVEMLRMAAARAGGSARVVAAAAEVLPFADGVFDTVVTSSSFHYWTAPLDGLREARRVLRPGGRLVIADWARDFAAMRVMDAVVRMTGHAFVRTYAEREIREMLGEAGLRVVRSHRAKISNMWGLWVVEARDG